MPNLGKTTIGAAVFAALFSAGTPASAQFTPAARMDPQRYNTLRSLAEYVDDGAQVALEQARTLVTTPRPPEEQALIQSLKDFARQAQAFHGRVDDYAFRPWQVSDDLTRLRTAARNASMRIRRVPAMRGTSTDWAAVMSDIDNMQRLVGGANVDLRRPNPAWDAATGPHHESAWPTYGTGALRDQRLEQFRTLARDLEASARRASDAAERQRSDYTANGEEHLVELHHFASQASQVRTRVDTGDVLPSDIGPLVTHLLEDARRADQSMRRARVFTGVWDEWSRTIDIVNQMSTLMR